MQEYLLAFKEFQQICKQHDIELILVFPPNFKKFNFNFEKRIRQLAFPETKLYIYNINDIRYKDKAYFFDESHLNMKGVEVFTNELSEFLKKL